MKLLFDQNLSPRLPHTLSSLYPGSAHVRDVALAQSDDAAVWEYAQQQGYAIVSKDSDFQQRCFLHGAPPKVVWIRAGNCPVATIEELLRIHSAAIPTFDLDDSEAFLIIPKGNTPSA